MSEYLINQEEFSEFKTKKSVEGRGSEDKKAVNNFYESRFDSQIDQHPEIAELDDKVAILEDPRLRPSLSELNTLEAEISAQYQPLLSQENITNRKRRRQISKNPDLKGQDRIKDKDEFVQLTSGYLGLKKQTEAYESLLLKVSQLKKKYYPDNDTVKDEHSSDSKKEESLTPLENDLNKIEAMFEAYSQPMEDLLSLNLDKNDFSANLQQLIDYLERSSGKELKIAQNFIDNLPLSTMEISEKKTNLQETLTHVAEFKQQINDKIDNFISTFKVDNNWPRLAEAYLIISNISVDRKQSWLEALKSQSLELAQPILDQIDINTTSPGSQIETLFDIKLSGLGLTSAQLAALKEQVLPHLEQTVAKIAAEVTLEEQAKAARITKEEEINKEARIWEEKAASLQEATVKFEILIASAKLKSADLAAPNSQSMVRTNLVTLSKENSFFTNQINVLIAELANDNKKTSDASIGESSLSHITQGKQDLKEAIDKAEMVRLTAKITFLETLSGLEASGNSSLSSGFDMLSFILKENGPDSSQRGSKPVHFYKLALDKLSAQDYQLDNSQSSAGFDLTGIKQADLITILKTFSSQPISKKNGDFSILSQISQEFEQLAEIFNKTVESAKFSDSAESDIFGQKTLSEVINSLYYRPRVGASQSTQDALTIHGLFGKQHYDHRINLHNWLEPKSLEKEKTITALKQKKFDFQQSVDAMGGMIGCGLYDSKNIFFSSLTTDELQLFSGGEKDVSRWKQGYLNDDAIMKVNISFNLANVFSIDSDFDWKTQENKSGNEGVLQKAIILISKVMQDHIADPDVALVSQKLAQKERAFSSAKDNAFFEGYVEYLIEAVFEVLQEKYSFFKDDSSETVDFYKDLVVFKACRDNLGRKYAIKSLGKDISALKGDMGGEPRPSGLLMSMIYNIVRGKTEGHAALLEFVDLEDVLSKLKDEHVEQTGKISEKITAGYQYIKDLKGIIESQGKEKHLQENKIYTPQYFPEEYSDDFVDMSWFANQTGGTVERVEIADGVYKNENKNILPKGAAAYYKAKQALMKILETAIGGVKPYQVYDANSNYIRTENIPVLINSINSQFSILAGIAGEHKEDNPLDFINQFALAAYKTHVKNIMLALEGRVTVSFTGKLTNEGSAYLNNYNQLFSAVKSAFGEKGNQLNSFYLDEMLNYLNSGKENFKAPKQKTGILSEALNGTESLDVDALISYNRNIFDNFPERTPWSSTENINENGKTIKIISLYATNGTKFAEKRPCKKTKLLPGHNLPIDFASFLRKKPSAILNFNSDNPWSSSIQGKEDN